MKARLTPRLRRSDRRLFAPALCLGILGSSQMTTSCANSDAFAIIQSHLVTTLPTPPSRYSCTQLSGNSGAEQGHHDTGIWITENQDEDGIVIEWGEGNTVLGKRQFSTQFFETGEMERFVIELPDGSRFSYMVWGAETCTPCPAQPYTPLPGDAFNCSTQVDAPDGSVPRHDVDDPNEANVPGER